MNEISIIAVTIVLGCALGWAYKRVRFGSDKLAFSNAEGVAILLMVMCACGLIFHLGVHGYFFGCRFSRCYTNATPWLMAYGISAVIQPAYDRLFRSSYARREWVAWAILSAGLLLLAVASGKAFNSMVYLAGREDVIHSRSWL